MLRVKAELYCDTCGLLPSSEACSEVGIRPRYSDNVVTLFEIPIAMGREYVLPRGWIFGFGDGETGVFCSETCKQRYSEALELRKRYKKPPGAPYGLSTTGTLTCAVMGCSSKVSRTHVIQHWYVLPERWVYDPKAYRCFCPSCAETPGVIEKYRKQEEESEP